MAHAMTATFEENCPVNNFPGGRLNVARSTADTPSVASSTSEASRNSRSDLGLFINGEFRCATADDLRGAIVTEGVSQIGVTPGGTPFRKVVETLAEHGASQSDSLALVDGSHSLTYSQLVSTVERFNQKLQRLGIRPGDRVGVALEPNVATVCVILALHSCGAAYVPLSDSQPRARLASMVSDAGLTFVLTPNSAPSTFDDLGVKRLDMTKLCAELASVAVDLPSLKTQQEPVSTTQASVTNAASPLASFSDTAYIIFTSGSTGHPKGVEITHANLDALLHAWDRVMGTTKHVSLLLSALTFDASIAELFWPLHHGGTLVIASKAEANHGGEGLGNLIRKYNISHLQCTPTRATLLLADPCDRAALAHLKHLVIGGEALTRPMAQLLLNAGIERITNAYGPTEATVWAFTHEVTGDLPTPVVAIGNPLFGVSAAIVDPLGNDVIEAGAIGELILGGRFVAPGYVNRVALTAELFASHIFAGSSEPLASYRTGDLVSRNPNGSLAFHGRSDEQVKIRGHRVELGEIEAALGTYRGVQQSVVCVQDRNGSNELIALVVADPTQTAKEPLDLLALRANLKGLLPAVMIPSRIVVVPRLPLNSSSKIDRVRVREELLTAIESGEHQAPHFGAPSIPQLPDNSSAHPQTQQFQQAQLRPQQRFPSALPLDAMIADFANALGQSLDTDRFLRFGKGTPGSSDQHVIPAAEVLIDKNTNFFAAGGHSMFAVALLTRIEDRTGIRVPLRELLSAPTPQQLNAVVQRHLEIPATAFDPLVRFGLSTNTRKLYLVHGAGGNVLRYRNLAGALHDVVDVVGIQAVGVEPGHEPDPTLAAMVNRYVEALLATGEQEFEIGGYSDGGVLAIHVAGRLVQAGRSVRSLTLLDAFVPGETKVSPLSQLANIGFSFSSRDTLTFPLWLRGSLLGWRRRKTWDEEGAEALRLLGYEDIYELNERAVQSEALPQRFSVPTLVVRTFEESPTRRRNYAIGYDPQKTTVAWVRGAHDQLLKPPSIPELEMALRTFLTSV
jgi:amino acid adenylation domain-containing protein